ncbi:MAG: hypothetical protein WC452_00690 [Aminobacteriaceae bacterium]|nr:hypothetical protein [Synergistaceae bacterium]
MQKNRIFWTSLLGACVFLSLVFLISGREPESHGLGLAIPNPADNAPYIFFEGEGKFFTLPVPEKIPRELSRARPLIDGLRPVFSLFGKASETAVLVSWESSRLQVAASLLYPGTAMKLLSEGVFPDDWKKAIPSLSMKKTGDGIYEVNYSSRRLPLFLSVNNKMTFIASSPEMIASMVEVFEKGDGIVQTPWTIEKKWANHLRVHDSGLISRLASLKGYRTPGGKVGLTAAWTGERTKGRMKWKAEGIEGFFPRELREGFLPVKWDDRFLAFEPFIAGAGIHLPESLSSEVLKMDTDNEIFPGRMKTEEMGTFLSGPVMGAISGTGKFLIFSLPGFYVQFPGRGEKGEQFVKYFWDQDWSLLVPDLEPVEGFSSGGTTAIPFSILGAANQDLVLLGILDRDNLRSDRRKKLPDAVPLLKEKGTAVFWFHLDGARLGTALANLAKAGRVAERMGRNIGMDLKDILRASEELKGIGRISVVLPSLDEGILEWRRAPQNRGKQAE